MSKKLVWALAVAACSFLVAAPAQAKPKTERVVGGHVTVTPSRQITTFLLSRGIKVTPIGGMKVGNGSLTMPMVGGQVQAPTMQGKMVASGGIEYSNGPKHVRVKNYRLIHDAHGARLTAVVNGHRILIARMVGTKTKMSGTSGRMTGGLRISAAWAHLINHLVGQHVVHPGEDIGDLSMRVKMA